MPTVQVKIGTRKKPVRFSYMNVFEARKMDENSVAKYSVTLLIPKDDEALVEKLEAAIAEAGQEAKAKNKGKLPRNFKNPLRDGDEERDGEEFEGMYFINASSKDRPGIVDKDLKKIVQDADYAEDDESEESLYSGCFGRAQVAFFAYDVSGNKGVACGLNFLQKIKDGDSLAGAGGSAASVFDDDDDDDEI